MPSIEVIQALVNRIAGEFDPEKIVLFGSYAYGTPTPQSDVDLLVVMPCSGSPVKQALAILKACGRPFPMDLIVRTPEELAWRYRGGDPWISDAMDKGMVLYERGAASHHRRMAS